jgi:hypothetical protein
MNTIPGTLFNLVEFSYSHAISYLQVCRLPVEHLCGQAVSCISKRQEFNHSLFHILLLILSRIYIEKINCHMLGTVEPPFFVFLVFIFRQSILYSLFHLSVFARFDHFSPHISRVNRLI